MKTNKQVLIVVLTFAWTATVNAQNRESEWFRHDQPTTGTPTKQKLIYGDSTNKGINDYFNRFGYHITRMNPISMQERGTTGNVPIFAQFPQDDKEYEVAGAYKIPSYYIYNSIQKSDSQLTARVFFSERQRMAEFSRNISLSTEGNTDFIGVGIKAGYKKSHESGQGNIRANEEASIFGEKIVQKYWLTLDKRRVKLDPGFAAAAVKLGKDLVAARGGKSRIKAVVSDFYKKYGTHYPLAILYGGRAYYEEYVRKKALSEALSDAVSEEFEVGLKTKMMDVALKSGYGKKNAAKVSRRDELKNLRVLTIGGTGTTFDSFNVTEANRAVPIRVELRPIRDILYHYRIPGVSDSARNLFVQHLYSPEDEPIDIPHGPVFDIVEWTVNHIEVADVLGKNKPLLTGSVTIGIGPYGDSSTGSIATGQTAGNPAVVFQPRKPVATTGEGFLYKINKSRRLVILPTSSLPSERQPTHSGIYRYTDAKEPKIYFTVFHQLSEVASDGKKYDFDRTRNTGLGPPVGRVPTTVDPTASGRLSFSPLGNWGRRNHWSHYYTLATIKMSGSSKINMWLENKKGTTINVAMSARRAGDTMSAIEKFPYAGNMAK